MRVKIIYQVRHSENLGVEFRWFREVELVSYVHEFYWFSIFGRDVEVVSCGLVGSELMDPGAFEVQCGEYQ